MNGLFVNVIFGMQHVKEDHESNGKTWLVTKRDSKFSIWFSHLVVALQHKYKQRMAYAKLSDWLMRNEIAFAPSPFRFQEGPLQS